MDSLSDHVKSLYILGAGFLPPILTRTKLELKLQLPRLPPQNTKSGSGILPWGYANREVGGTPKLEGCAENSPRQKVIFLEF